MSTAGPCKNATSPINITTTAARCKKICDYSFKYALSDCVLTNKGSYLDIKTTLLGNMVLFNNERMNVKEVRLYHPSLHTFNTSHVDAELVIHHIGGGHNLLVCIPINIADGQSKSTDFFHSFLPYIPQNEGDKATANVTNWSLNDIIPKAPYYFYQATAPYPPCTGVYNIIVFDKGTGVHMLRADAKQLSVIKENKLDIHKVSDSGLYYNKTGTGTVADDIYIDCRPVGSSGEVEPEPVTEDKSPKSLKDLMENPLFSILGGIIILITLKKMYNRILKAF